jgi:hypothetical protein
MLQLFHSGNGLNAALSGAKICAALQVASLSNASAIHQSAVGV